MLGQTMAFVPREARIRYSFYSLYQYKSTNTDTEGAAGAGGRARMG
jgi:hypothetical protein